MDGQPLALVAAPPGGGHVDVFARVAPDPPEGRGVAGAEHRAGAAGEDRGTPAAFEVHVRVADCVHARVEHVKPSALGPVVDLMRAEPECNELPPGHDPVLALGELRHPDLTWDLLTAIIAVE